MTMADEDARLEDIQFMIDHRETGDGAAERMGLTPEGLRKWLDAHGRLDMFEALRENERWRFGATLAEIRRDQAARARRGPKRRTAA